MDNVVGVGQAFRAAELGFEDGVDLAVVAQLGQGLLKPGSTGGGVVGSSRILTGSKSYRIRFITSCICNWYRTRLHLLYWKMG